MEVSASLRAHDARFRIVAIKSSPLRWEYSHTKQQIPFRQKKILSTVLNSSVLPKKRKSISFLVSDLIHCTNEPNVSIPSLANLLIERSQNTNWTVVFKALITVHHMLCYGNEVIIFRFFIGSHMRRHPYFCRLIVKWILYYRRGSHSISPPATAHFSSAISSTRAAYKVIIFYTMGINWFLHSSQSIRSVSRNWRKVAIRNFILRNKSETNVLSIKISKTLVIIFQTFIFDNFSD